MHNIIRFLLILIVSCFVCTNAATPFIIDTDMGVDDVIAILYMLQRKDIDVLAITVASTGNIECAYGIKNAEGLLALTHYKKIPVACGKSKPLWGNHRFPMGIIKEGDTLGGAAVLLPTIKDTTPSTAIHILSHTLQKAHQPISILAIGPLTNIAEFIQAYPRLLHKIKHIYWMGGAINVSGNIHIVDHLINNTVSEWNSYIDPKAVQIVFQSKIPLTIIPLDVTNKLPVQMDFYQALQKNHATPASGFVFEILKRNQAYLKSGDWWYFWDPLAAVVATNPEIMHIQKMPLKVLIQHKKVSGQLIVDKSALPLDVCMNVNSRDFKRLLVQALTKNHKS